MKPSQIPMPVSNFYQRGLSLVELVIGMAIGLVVVSALGYIYLGARQSYVMQDNMARVQENGRYALELLSRDIRMAGYMGCPSLSYLTPNVIANTPPAASFGLTNTLVGYEAGSGWTNSTSITRVGNSDVILINRASTQGINLTGNMAAVNANIQITGNPQGFVANDVLFITDCSHADIFRATSVSTGSGTITVAHSNSHNTSNNLSYTYGPDAMVMAYESSLYFIGTNAVGDPALYLVPWSGSASGNAQEMVENVEDMQITFGVDNTPSPDGDGQIDTYVAAGAVTNWGQVRSVRIRLLLRGPDAGVTSQPQTYLWDTNNDGNLDSVTATDRRLHYVFSTTIGIRNRLP